LNKARDNKNRAAKVAAAPKLFAELDPEPRLLSRVNVLTC
jgi:hypothetical protein